MTSAKLPVHLTNFLGRTRELVEVDQLLSTYRLVTLTGPGGCGKTRLAIQVAYNVNDAYADGVWLVDLTSIREATLVPQLVAQTLGLRLAPDKPVLELLTKWVEVKDLLLILDNCEHLIAACAQLTKQLLIYSNKLRILATSREPLNITGEAVYPVSGLAWPFDSTQVVDNPQVLLQYDAPHLFIERVSAIIPGFRLTRANAGLIVEICQRLDGLPLALELASARCNVLTLRQIAERLDDRFNLLISRPHSGTDPRHQTLRAAIDWSYELLAPSEQVLFRRLAVFAGGCSLATAEAVCTGEGVEGGQVLELLSSLVDKSLVVAQTLQRGEGRYFLLETIREFAQEKLIILDEWTALRDRHLQCFLDVAEKTASKISGQYQRLWLNWLEGEYDNVRASLSWSLEGGRIEAGMRIAIALYQFWTIRDYVEEALAWVERLLEQADARISPVVRANTLAYAAFLAGFRGNTPAQIAYGHEAKALAEAAGEEGKPALVWALGAQAYAARASGDNQTEYALVKQAIQLWRELGNTDYLGISLSTASFTAMSLNKFDEARAMLDEGLALLRETGNSYRIAMALNFSGDLARCEQNYHEAQKVYEESISLLREIGAVRDLASVLQNLGHTCLHLGDLERAWDLFAEGLTIQLAQENRPGVAECLIGYAAMAVAVGRHAAGARLLAAAEALGGQRITTAWPATRMEYEQCLAHCRAALTEPEFRNEQAAGDALSFERAVEYARTLSLGTSLKMAGQGKQEELTHRELEVVVMIGQGKSNGEIAEALVISKRTVEAHITHIRSKLGFTNRAQIIHWVIQEGIVKPIK